MPIFTIAAIAITGAAAGSIIVVTTAAILQAATGVALSMLAQKIAGKQDEPAEAAALEAYGIRGRLQGGADLPRSILLGYRATAGSLVWANTWGGVDTVENKFITQVIALADYPLPATGLVGMWVNGEKVTIEASSDGDFGKPIEEYRGGKDDNANLWVKFYDGTQTTVDPLCNGDASTGDRDYESTRVGRGVAYVVVTAKVRDTLWSGLPTFKFELNGAKLYDISKDSTAGGSGSHLWSNPATWGGDGDHLPVVQIYNLLRGFEYNGEWLYGLQGMTAARLPAANWIAQINKCRASVTGPDGSEPKYRSSLEIPVNSQMADAIEQLLTACQGRLSESGGFYKIQCGAPDAASFTLTDEDILSTEEQSFTPFFGLSDTINGVTASYPEPEEAWNDKPAPPLYRTDLEVSAGGRRLLADVALDAVPYANQVQRLMLESLQEAQRARRHTIVVGPEFWPAEPGDFLEWTSERNNYINKLFRIDGVADKGNLDVMLDMTEVDPADYDYDYGSDYEAPVIGPNTPIRPAPQPIIDFDATAVEVESDVAGVKRPGILIEWAIDAVEDLNDVDAIAYEVRRASDDVVILRGRTDNQEAGSVVIEGVVILPSTNYEVRGRYVPFSAREVEWSSWVPVTTLATLYDSPDLEEGSATSMNDTQGADVTSFGNEAILVSMAHTTVTGNIAITWDADLDMTKNLTNPASSATFEMWIDAPITITQASPAEINYPAHGLVANQRLRFTTTGSLPTGGLSTSGTFFVKTVLNANKFTVSGTAGGTAINATSAGSGSHKVAARYATRRVLTTFLDGGDAKIRGGLTWMRRFSISTLVSHTVTIRVGTWDFGGGSNTCLGPVLIIFESRR